MIELLTFLVGGLIISVMHLVNQNTKLESKIFWLDNELTNTKSQLKSVTSAVLQLSTEIAERKTR